MSAASLAAPRAFVSHSHADNVYCRQFVEGLRRCGLEVWYDEHNLGWGALRQVIERELQAREHFIAILSPAAVASDWVNAEIDAALFLLGRGQLRSFLLVTAAPCDVPLLLQRYKRIEAPGGQGYAPGEAAIRTVSIVAPELVVARAPAAGPVAARPDNVAPLVMPSPQAASSQPAVTPDHFPPRLAALGFTAGLAPDGKYILPPVCDVAAGEFLMGSDPKRDRAAENSEKPQHRVALAAYQIARFPVTVAEYACFVRAGCAQPATGYHGVDWPTQLTRLDRPVTSVSWHDAVAYAAWLAERTGERWRLPSEAEWEKAARGADGRIYPWGDAYVATRCNTLESGAKTTTPVDRYPSGASPCGVLDLAGNVWEWTASEFQPYPYTLAAGREPREVPELRVLRGGSWMNRLVYVRAAYRYPVAPVTFTGNIGFRLVCVAPGS
jgi:formylglycine-generating enzyme required for sulfatase activity